MKSTSLALFLGSALLLAETAGADNLRVYGAWQDGDDYSSASGYGIRLSLGAPFGIELGYNRFDSLKLDLGDDVDVEISDLDTDIFDLGLRLGLPLNFYLGGGASYYKLDDRKSFIDDEVGLYALAGWSFGGERWRVFGESLYRYVEGTVDYVIGETDVSLASFGVNAGVMLQW